MMVRAAAALLGAVGALAVTANANAGRSPTAALSAAPARGATVQSTLPITVTVDARAPGRPVGPRFLGLSFEAAALGQLAKYADRGDLVGLMRSLGPGLLRFGGVTADQNVAWTDATTPRPAWASGAIDPAQLRAIGVLARRSGWQVLLTVGLAHYEPAAAAREVAVAQRALGSHLAAVEIGNEPDAYASHGFRALPWIAQGYEEEVSSYREAIAALTPGVPIAGPDVTGSGVFPEWGADEALSQRPALLTGHHYPLGCTQKHVASIEALLSAAVRGNEARSLATYLSVSDAYGIPLRIDETNSVSCGGTPGISDTFASALWATSYITQAMAAGAAGINLEGNPTNCAGYTPLCAPDQATLATGSLHAEPDWYALLLTRSLVGQRPLRTMVVANGAPDLTAAAFAGSGGSRTVVLVNDEPTGTSPLALRLDIGGGNGTARVLRLTAPSQSATTGVLLGGRAVASDGSWREPSKLPQARDRHGVVAVDLAPDSAALLTLSATVRRPRSSR